MSARTVEGVIDSVGDIPEGQNHLRLSTRDDNETLCLRCRNCGNPVTVDPGNGLEYGHVRKADRGGPCKYRPREVEPNNCGRGESR